MVTQKDRSMVTIVEMKRFLNESKTIEEVEVKLNGLKPRRVKPQSPLGGITLRDASRKYKIPPATLSNWLRYGWITLLKSEGKFKFLKESEIKKLSRFSRSAGRSIYSNFKADYG